MLTSVRGALRGLRKGKGVLFHLYLTRLFSLPRSLRTLGLIPHGSWVRKFGPRCGQAPSAHRRVWWTRSAGVSQAYSAWKPFSWKSYCSWGYTSGDTEYSFYSPVFSLLLPAQAPCFPTPTPPHPHPPTVALSLPSPTLRKVLPRRPAPKPMPGVQPPPRVHRSPSRFPTKCKLHSPRGTVLAGPVFVPQEQILPEAVGGDTSLRTSQWWPCPKSRAGNLCARNVLHSCLPPAPRTCF